MVKRNRIPSRLKIDEAENIGDNTARGVIDLKQGIIHGNDVAYALTILSELKFPQLKRMHTGEHHEPFMKMKRKEHIRVVVEICNTEI